MTESKTYGRVYTPKFLVKLILDKAGYNSYEGIIGKHIIDNSCGDGAFLMEIVSRYCTFFSGSVGELANHLQTYCVLLLAFLLEYHQKQYCLRDFPLFP